MGAGDSSLLVSLVYTHDRATEDNHAGKEQTQTNTTRGYSI